MTTTTAFRLNAQNLFLTYPTCSLTPQKALTQLQGILPGIESYIIAQESHEDGQKHLHCYIRLSSRVNLKDPARLDLKSGPTTFHGNYQACRNSSAVKKYVTKEGVYLTNMDLEAPDRNAYQSALALAEEGKVSEALATLRSDKRGARDLVLQKEKIEASLRGLKKRKVNVRHGLETFQEFVWDREKSLVIQGPTGVGKTALAKALLGGDALLVSHIDWLKNFVPGEHTGVIFDDMNFGRWPRESVIHLVDTGEDRQIHCRYACGFLPEGTPRIFTTNHEWNTILGDDPAIKRRLQVIDMFAPDDIRPQF